MIPIKFLSVQIGDFMCDCSAYDDFAGASIAKMPTGHSWVPLPAGALEVVSGAVKVPAGSNFAGHYVDLGPVTESVTGWYVQMNVNFPAGDSGALNVKLAPFFDPTTGVEAPVNCLVAFSDSAHCDVIFQDGGMELYETVRDNVSTPASFTIRFEVSAAGDVELFVNGVSEYTYNVSAYGYNQYSGVSIAGFACVDVLNVIDDFEAGCL